MRIIKSDGHDEDQWRRALADSLNLRRVRDEGVQRFAAFGDMLADVFHLVLKATPCWEPPAHPTLHEAALRELADLTEFRELRALAGGHPEGAVLATCILGRLLAQQLDKGVMERLKAEAEASTLQAEAMADAQLAADLAGELGAAHPAVVEAQAAASAATAGCAPADAITPAALDDLVVAFRKAARAVARDAVADLDRVTEAERLVGAGRRASLDAKLAIAERLASSRKFADLVAIAGRVRRIALACRAAIVKDVPPEIVGVVNGRDLARTLPVERALLALPATRAHFIRKLAEGQLLTYEQRSEEPLGRGPIVICLDGSGSMAGAREVWSKGVALGFMAVAERERRDLRLCQFGGPGQLRVWDFPYRTRPDAVSSDDTLDAVECFMDAGATDLPGALLWAANQIEAEPARLGEADVVVLTDAEVSFSPSFLARWREVQNRLGFRSAGVLIGEQSYAAVLAQAIAHVIPLIDVAHDASALESLFSR